MSLRHVAGVAKTDDFGDHRRGNVESKTECAVIIGAVLVPIPIAVGCSKVELSEFDESLIFICSGIATKDVIHVADNLS